MNYQKKNVYKKKMKLYVFVYFGIKEEAETEMMKKLSILPLYFFLNQKRKKKRYKRRSAFCILFFDEAEQKHESIDF